MHFKCNMKLYLASTLWAKFDFSVSFTGGKLALDILPNTVSR